MGLVTSPSVTSLHSSLDRIITSKSLSTSEVMVEAISTFPQPDITPFRPTYLEAKNFGSERHTGATVEENLKMDCSFEALYAISTDYLSQKILDIYGVVSTWYSFPSIITRLHLGLAKWSSRTNREETCSTNTSMMLLRDDSTITSSIFQTFQTSG